MNSTRRADSRRALLPRTLAVAAGAFAALSLALTGIVSVKAASRVVTPVRREPDLEILSVNVSAQTITLSRTPDTELPGRYGLFVGGALGYVKLGAVLSVAQGAVTRKLLTRVEEGALQAGPAAFSGWYFDGAEQLHLPYSDEKIATPLGDCPAWYFPADAAETWVIQIHGRGTTRAETLRAVPTFRSLGVSSLCISYRNDGVGPDSASGKYGLGSTEWEDVEEAIRFAKRRGAKKIFLMGWSMGGAIAMQLVLRSAHREMFQGVILESPVMDWDSVLRFQARQNGYPAFITTLAERVLATPLARLVGLERVIRLREMNMVARARELTLPMLILHSDDDGFVPSDASREIARLRPELVDLEVFHTARHTKLWNYDEERWNEVIRRWSDRASLRGASTTR